MEEVRPADPDEIEIARRKMHEAIDNLDAVKLAYEAGAETLANLSAAMDKSHQATDRYFDVRRKALG
jgi:hypothetical protein